MQKLLLVSFLVVVSLTSVYSISFDYPSSFKDKEIQIIVGENASKSDYSAALQLSNDLSHEAILDEGIVTTKSFVSSTIPIGSFVPSYFDEEIDSKKLKGLEKNKISFQGKKYDTSEVLFLVPENIRIQNSLNGDFRYGDTPFLEFNRNSVKYYYNFDNEIDLKKITPQAPLRINFLGKSLLITKINSDGSFNAEVSDDYFLKIGDSVNLGAKSIILENIDANGNILVRVGSSVKVIPSSSSRIIEGISVFNEKNFYVNEISERSAKLLIGESLKKVFSNGDPFINQDKNKPRWKWIIGNLETIGRSYPGINNHGEGPYIGVTNSIELNDFSKAPPKKGECFNLPNNYIQICFDNLLNDDYKLFNFEIEKSTDLSKELGDKHSKVKSVKLSVREGSEGFVIMNNLDESKITAVKKTKEIFLYSENSEKIGIFYKDDSEKRIKLAGYINDGDEKAFSEVKHGNTKGKDIEIYAKFEKNSMLKLKLKSSSSDSGKILDDLGINFKIRGSEILSLGDLSQTSEDGELTWNGKNIGLIDKDSLTNYGIVVKNPRSNGNSDLVRFAVPNNQLKAVVNIIGPESTKIENKQRSIIISPEVVLDSNNFGVRQNIILIGGPCANLRVEELFDISCATWNLKEGESLLKLKEINEKLVLLIAGTTAQDTVNAVNILETLGFGLDENVDEKILLY